MVTKKELETVLKCVKISDLKNDEISLIKLKYRIGKLLEPFLEESL